ncbi:MAG: MFS transporter [Firmicutes bacterium]|nr:MFS transporter [Alicyclobacillaceae bacterium]MCL6498397.1 MFS transporter [Bacillota bacterium]
MRLWSRDFVLTLAVTALIYPVFLGVQSTASTVTLTYHWPPWTTGAQVAAVGGISIAMRPWAGRVLDRLGPQRPLVAALLAFLGVLVGMGSSRSIPAVIALRVAQGVAWSLLNTATATIIQLLAPPPRRGEATGWYAVFGDLGMVVGPVLVAIVGVPQWFWWSAAVAAAATGLALGVGSGRHPVPQPGARPVPRALWSRVWVPTVAQALTNTAFILVAAYTGSLAAARGWTWRIWPGVPVYTELFAGYGLALLATRPILGRLSDRFGRPAVAIPALGLLTLATVAEAHWASASRLWVIGALVGVGYGGAQTALLAWAGEAVPPALRGRAVGTYYAGFDAGISATGVLSAILVAHLGWPGVYSVCAAGPGMAALLVSATSRTRHAVPPASELL